MNYIRSNAKKLLNQKLKILGWNCSICLPASCWIVWFVERMIGRIAHHVLYTYKSNRWRGYHFLHDPIFSSGNIHFTNRNCLVEGNRAPLWHHSHFIFCSPSCSTIVHWLCAPIVINTLCTFESAIVANRYFPRIGRMSPYSIIFPFWNTHI